MSRLTFLQQGGGFACASLECLIFLGARGGGGIDALEILQRQGRKALVDGGGVRETAQLVVQRGDEEPHLEAPVAEVRVAPHLVAAKSARCA